MIDHHRATSDWLRPGHIAERCRNYRTARVRDVFAGSAPEVTAPDGEGVARELATRRALTEAAASGRLDRAAYRAYLDSGRAWAETMPALAAPAAPVARTAPQTTNHSPERFQARTGPSTKGMP